MARSMVDGLAEAVSQNRTALMALAALKEYDNYTFTHMVNVSILTMAQARALGIDGALLREFGMAALMHDIGQLVIYRQLPVESTAILKAVAAGEPRELTEEAVLGFTHAEVGAERPPSEIWKVIRFWGALLSVSPGR